MITPESKRVLSVVLNNGTIRGFELKKLSGYDSNALVNAVQPLICDHFITASGIVNLDTLDRVTFSPLTSAYENSFSLLQ